MGQTALSLNGVVQAFHPQRAVSGSCSGRGQATPEGIMCLGTNDPTLLRSWPVWCDHMVL